jgi:hypothetical protein
MSRVQQGVILTGITLRRREVADTTMAMFEVVPLDEPGSAVRQFEQPMSRHDPGAWHRRSGFRVSSAESCSRAASTFMLLFASSRAGIRLLECLDDDKGGWFAEVCGAAPGVADISVRNTAGGLSRGYTERRRSAPTQTGGRQPESLFYPADETETVSLLLPSSVCHGTRYAMSQEFLRGQPLREEVFGVINVALRHGRRPYEHAKQGTEQYFHTYPPV